MALVNGFGFNDRKYPSKINKVHTPQYSKWRMIINRCFNEKYKTKYPNYADCKMDERFLDYSYFYEWYNQNLISGEHTFQLDKDLLVRGNKEYHPDKCVFLPREINNTFIRREAGRGECLIGVTRTHGVFSAQVGIGGECVFLGRFNSEVRAFQAYKKAKERIIRDLAEKYRDQIDVRAYSALMNYTVEMTD